MAKLSKRTVQPPQVPRPGEPLAAAGDTGHDVQPRSGQVLADWPVHEVLVNSDWQSPHSLAVVRVVRRRPPYDRLIMGQFLVDLQCLGVKDAFTRQFRDVMAYDRDMIRSKDVDLDMIPADFDLAAKIVFEGTRYAATLGIRPHRDAEQAIAVLAGARPDACPVDIPLGGPNGRPVYVAGPYDDVARIVRQLDEGVGPGNYDCVIVLKPDDDLMTDDW